MGLDTQYRENPIWLIQVKSYCDIAYTYLILSDLCGARLWTCLWPGPFSPLCLKVICMQLSSLCNSLLSSRCTYAADTQQGCNWYCLITPTGCWGRRGGRGALGPGPHWQTSYLGWVSTALQCRWEPVIVSDSPREGERNTDWEMKKHRK